MLMKVVHIPNEAAATKAQSFHYFLYHIRVIYTGISLGKVKNIKVGDTHLGMPHLLLQLEDTIHQRF